MTATTPAADGAPGSPAVRDALVDVARLGPFSAIDPTGSVDPSGPPWLPGTAMLDGGGALADRIAATRTALVDRTPGGAVEWRVAASLAHLGLVGRIVSPVLALAAAHGLVLDAAPQRWWWQPVLGRPFPLWFPDPQAVVAAPGPAVRAALRRRLVEPVVLPLAAAVRAVAALPGPLLAGNTASALAGAVAAFTAVDPGVGAGARDLVTDLLDADPLRGAGSFVSGPGPARFRRTTCCLYYRSAPDAGVCGDCVFTTPPARRAR